MYEKVVTPGNFMLLQMVLFSFSLVCDAYDMSTPMLIIALVQMLSVGCSIGFLWWQSRKELQALKRDNGHAG